MASSDVSTQRGPIRSTVLGNTQRVRLPVGGKIRPGVMALTRAAAQNPEIVQIYERGVQDNLPFEQIGDLIAARFPELRDKALTPRNTPYFVVRRCDFSNPMIADQIMEVFGEEKDDGVRRLYRFPAVFASDSWESVMPHDLAVYNRHERLFWSEYSADGRTRYCKMHAPAKLDGPNGRPLRNFGARPTQLRPDNNGICDPDSCPEFQARKCNLTGRFLFFIPGIKSGEAFELPTGSFYAMSRAVQLFEAISFMRGGRLAGFLDNAKTTFFFCKKLIDVKRIDDRGRPVRTQQWIITLEAPVDPSALIEPPDIEDTLRTADVAAGVLAGEVPLYDPGVIDVISDRPTVDQTTDMPPQPRQAAAGTGKAADPTPDAAAVPTLPQPPRDSEVRDQHARSGASVEPDKSQRQAPVGPDARRSTVRPPAKEDIIEIGQLLGDYEIDPDKFDQYTAGRWGEGWNKNAMGCKNVLDELRRYRNDPQGMRDKIDAMIAQHNRDGEA